MSIAVAPVAEATLPFCPRCGYSLRGLPAAHRCPECGLGYDGASRMWVAGRGRVWWRRDARLFTGAMNVLIGLGIAGQLMFVAGKARPWLVAASAVNIGLGMTFVAMWLDRQHRRTAFLATLPDGVWFRGYLNRPRCARWETVGRAEANRAGDPRTLMLRRRKGRSLYLGDVLGSEAEVGAFVEAVGARVEARSGRGLGK